MKHFETAHQLRYAAVAKDVKKRASLSEQEIIELQDCFLTPGFHLITVEDRESGRELLTRFVEALRYHSQVGILTTHTSLLNSPLSPRQQSYGDVYEELRVGKAFFRKEALAEYFLHAFAYDFLAIEGSDDLLRASWFGKFEHFLIEYDIIRLVPVVLFCYKK